MRGTPRHGLRLRFVVPQRRMSISTPGALGSLVPTAVVSNSPYPSLLLAVALALWVERNTALGRLVGGPILALLSGMLLQSVGVAEKGGMDATQQLMSLEAQTMYTFLESVRGAICMHPDALRFLVAMALVAAALVVALKLLSQSLRMDAQNAITTAKATCWKTGRRPPVTWDPEPSPLGTVHPDERDARPSRYTPLMQASARLAWGLLCHLAWMRSVWLAHMYSPMQVGSGEQGAVEASKSQGQTSGSPLGLWPLLVFTGEIGATMALVVMKMADKLPLQSEDHKGPQEVTRVHRKKQHAMRAMQALDGLLITGGALLLCQLAVRVAPCAPLVVPGVTAVSLVGLYCWMWHIMSDDLRRFLSPARILGAAAMRMFYAAVGFTVDPGLVLNCLPGIILFVGVSLGFILWVLHFIEMVMELRRGELWRGAQAPLMVGVSTIMAIGTARLVHGMVPA